MLRDIKEVRYLGDYRVYLRFDDDVAGELDLASLIQFDGIFAPLKDSEFFSKVEVHPELGTIFWPNGADLDPVVLYCRLTGSALPEYRKTTVA
jgi:hypothetical protein